MSNQLDPISDPLNIATIQTIDQLDLPLMQKHHLRILAHCLAILKVISRKNSSSKEILTLREWCNNQSQKFNDQKFSDLFYEQIDSTAKKLKNFSEALGKNIDDLKIEDLVLLVRGD